MELFHRIARRSKYHQQEKYKHRLLSGEIRIQEIPQDLLRDPATCTVLYILGFRVDRGISRQRYDDDLSFLRSEMLLAEAEENKALQEALKSAYQFVYAIYEAKYLEA